MSAATAYYMRDNHTFLKLPNDPDEALKLIAAEVRDGFSHGMLCSKQYSVGVHLQGKEDWLSFEEAARDWFASYLAAQG